MPSDWLGPSVLQPWHAAVELEANQVWVKMLALGLAGHQDSGSGNPVLLTTNVLQRQLLAVIPVACTDMGSGSNMPASFANSVLKVCPTKHEPVTCSRTCLMLCSCLLMFVQATPPGRPHRSPGAGGQGRCTSRSHTRPAWER